MDDQHRRAPWIVAVLLLLGLAVRLPLLDTTPESIATDRQYQVRIVTRWLSDVIDPSATDAEREASRRAALEVGVYEAPVIPVVAALGYRLTGAESWWLPRLVSIGAWMAGAVLLERVLRRLTGSGLASAAGLAVFLLTPVGITMSRSIQPDALMVAGVVAAWWATISASDRPSTRRWVGAVLVGALAVLVKGLSIFLVVPLVIVSIRQLAPSRRSARRRIVGVVGGQVLLGSIFYAGSALLTGTLGGQVRSSVLPALLLSFEFWRAWYFNAGAVVGLLTPLAVIAVAVGTRRLALARHLGGLAAGYAAMSSVFSWRTGTHLYYALPMVPIASLAVAAAFVGIEQWVDRRGAANPSDLSARPVIMGLASVVTAALLLGGSRGLSYGDGRPGMSRELADEVGEVTAHSGRVVFFTDDYGFSLRLDSRIGGVSWPATNDLLSERLQGLPSETSGDRLRRLVGEGFRYFVSTRAMGEEYHSLEAALAGYPTVMRRNDVVIWDLGAG